MPTDIGRAYIKAAREYLPKATLLYDHFHAIKRYNEQFTKPRQEVANEADAHGKKTLKGHADS